MTRSPTLAGGDGALRLAGRVLFLCDRAEPIVRQLQGEDLTRAQAGTLRSDISTDEITPVTALTVWDAALGRVPYTGLAVAGAGGRLVTPVGRDTVRAGGFTVVVAGARYGKGSSREHSPMAEWHAGVRLVVAPSFERIYRQNADNVGLVTCTDLSVVDRLQRGDAIELDELLADRDALAAAIVRGGGLMRWGARALHGAATRPMPQPMTPGAAPRPRTLVEKIIERHRLAVPGFDTGDVQPGLALWVRADWRFFHEYYTGMIAHLIESNVGAEPAPPAAIVEPGRVRAFEDHVSLAGRSDAHVRGGLLPSLGRMVRAHRAFVARHGFIHHGALAGDEGFTGSEGISHPMMAERYARPGELVAGTDSHTPHSGALGCLAFGVGSTDMANALVTGALRLVVPETLRVRVDGRLPAGVMAKDLVLQLLAQPAIRAGAGLGRVFEFCGAAVRALDTDERATLTNLAAELGGFTGIVAPDAETERFLFERRGERVTVEPWMTSDDDAAVADTLVLDAAQLEPWVAAPGDPGRGQPLSGVAPLHERPRIDIAYGGSCTGGKRADFDHYHAVLAWALAHGRTLAPGVRLFLQCGTLDVHAHCARMGYLDTFSRMGAEVLMPSCGACANCGPGASTHAGEVTVSAINRNFPGRGGPGAVWLASPPTVAASAIAGRLCSFAELTASARPAALIG